MTWLVIGAMGLASVAHAGSAEADAEAGSGWAIPGDGHSEVAPIVNGSNEEGFPQTLALGAFGFSACTGSLITPKLVLSAGHCGDGIPLDLVVELGSAYIGPSVGEAVEEIGFKNLEVHPDYVPLGGSAFGQTLPEYDLAVLQLERAVTSVEPIWFRTKSMKDRDLGETVTSVGFGITGASSNDSGIKRSAELVVDAYDDQFILSYTSTNPNEAQICSGDSGGPQYYWDEDNGRYLQWAVHSWGDANCLYESGSTRTDIAADWILGIVEAVHGTTDVCEINGHYSNGVCDEFCDTPDPDCNPVAPTNPLGTGSGNEAGETEAVKSGCSHTAPAGGWWGLLAAVLLGWRRRD